MGGRAKDNLPDYISCFKQTPWKTTLSCPWPKLTSWLCPVETEVEKLGVSLRCISASSEHGLRFLRRKKSVHGVDKTICISL